MHRLNPEISKEIPGSPGYFATETGQIIGRWGNPLRLTVGTNGRLGVQVWFEGRWRRREVHVMVCLAFHGLRPLGKVASHLDGNMLNNCADNLVWETQAENLARRKGHGTSDKGLQNTRSVMTAEKVRLIRERATLESHQTIANSLGISRTTVSRIVNGLRYEEVA